MSFIPGLVLAERFFAEVVRPLLAKFDAPLTYSAALLGPGSEVLGLDTAMSTDHDWGPRHQIFLSDEDYQKFGRQLGDFLQDNLPESFRGYPTRFPEEGGARHRVQITTLKQYSLDYVGIDLSQELTTEHWLLIPEQKLLTLVSGVVFADELAILNPLRQRLAYYPRDIWLYLLSAQWQRIGQEEHLAARAGTVGDELGSTLIACRLVRDVMRLAFLMEKQYAPYPKWLGTAFAKLRGARRLSPILRKISQGSSWQQRQQLLVQAFARAVELHNQLGITAPLPPQPRQFFDRPFPVIWGGQIAETIWQAIADPEIRKLPYGLGKVDQIADNTDFLEKKENYLTVKELYTSDSQ